MRSIEDDTTTPVGTRFIASASHDREPVAATVTIADIWEAHKLLKPRLHHTPLTPSRTLRDLTGADIYLKAENTQRSGSFKVRGASYKLSRLTPQEYERGVIAASAGNHAQGVAIAAAQYHIPCTIVMPETAPLAKVMATQSYGATVVLHGFTYDDAYQRCRELQEQSGATFIHAFDDPDITAGQGTLGLEMLSDLPDADALVVPVGGGGLISGIAIAARALRPDITIIGVQAAGAACFRASLDAGEVCSLPAIATIAGGAIAGGGAGGAQLRFDAWRISLAEAVARAGGLNDAIADPASVFLYRGEPREVAQRLGIDCSKFEGPIIPIIYNVNFRDPSGYFLATAFEIRNKDVLYVSNSTSVQVAKFLFYLRTIMATANDPISYATNFFALKNLINGPGGTVTTIAGGTTPITTR